MKPTLLYPKHTILRNIHNIYYRIERGSKAENMEFFKFFDVTKPMWKRYSNNYGGTPLEIMRHLTRIPDPVTPYNCIHCKNKGCDTCKPVPWSIYNVLKR